MHESKQQMDRIEFLVEELSMAELLKVVLPRILPAPWELDNNYYIHPHEGKSDLKRSIPTKLRAYRKRPFSTCFVVIQDQDSNDCKQLKQELVDLCKANKSDNITYLVRIVCHELEAWYMGDVEAIQSVFPRFKANMHRSTRIFRNPDACVNPKERLKKIVGEYPQIETAHKMAQQMDTNNNKSESFNQFVSGILKLIKAASLSSQT